MNVLRSRANPRVRRWQRLAQDGKARRAQARALIEGTRLVGACIAAGGEIEELLVSQSGLARKEISGLVDRAGVELTVLSDAVFRAVVDTETPQGIAAEVVIPDIAPVLAESKGAVMLDRIQDAGNVGAILRSAAAFGVQDVFLSSGCADPWSPKVLRAAMGGHFSLRIGASRNPVADLERFPGTVACAVPRGGVPVASADIKGPVLWILGSEAEGVRADLATRADLRVTIPMPGAIESMNVAAAAAILFYEASRREK